MIAATYTQGGELAIGDQDKPSIRPGEILLRVEAASICGTDVKIVRHGHRKLGLAQTIVLGHEFTGTIEEVGPEVTGYKPGQRVGIAPNWGCGDCEACHRNMANYCVNFSAFGINTDGGHAEWVRIPGEVVRQGNITVLPENVSWEMASLAEPLSCVLGAQEAINLSAKDSVLIYGAGPMGLLHVVAAAAANVKTIIAVDPNVQRLDVARALGATHVLQARLENIPDRAMKLTEGKGLDVVITAASRPEIVPEAFGLLGIFGRLCLFAGLPKDRSEVLLDANLIHYRKLTVTGTTGGTNTDHQRAIELISQGRIDVTKIVSHRFPFSKLQQAYDTALTGKGLKIVIGRSY